MYAHNYDALFTSILENVANDMNIKQSGGFPLANINPTLGMLSGIFKDSIITPYVADNYLYAGFSMQADLPTLAAQTEFI